jgi:hypothetical protein
MIKDFFSKLHQKGIAGISLLAFLFFVPFFAFGQPDVTGFSPASGAVGATVVISGSGFSTTLTDNEVTFFNGIPATVTASTANSITVEVPSGATDGPITVTIAGDTDISDDDFTVLPTPSISSFTPTTGAETATVTITGTNFSATPANNQVRFFNGVLANVTASTPTSITTSVPAGAATGPISVLVSGTGVTVTSASDFTVTPTPTITSFTPTSGAETATVTITGTNFSATPANNQVRFFNNVLATVTASTPTSITTSVPAGAATGPISVLVSGTGVTVTSASDFTVTPTPTITSFTPTSGAETATVTITGTNFSTTPANNQVRFFNNVLATVTASTPTSITTSVPAGATTGPISVLVSGTGVTITSASDFTVTPTPTITSFTPTSGAETATVTITGTNFSATPANNQVRFFNNVLATVTASTPTSITTSVPAGAATGPISVLVSGTGVTITSASDFTVTPTPTITSFTPTSGAETATVTITGTNFSTTPANNQVRFFNNVLATVTASTPTSITTSVPAGAATGPISVLVSGTGVTVTSASDFTVTPTPTITSFTPTSGAETATVTITGTNFSTTPANNQVRFFNNVLATVTASTPTSITTSVPAGAATGPISVLVSGTGVTVTSAGSFTILPAPVIDGFSPTSGAVGVNVTINGDNFSATPTDNVVTFNGATAVVTSVTPNRKNIMTTVPAGATTGPIAVTTSGVTVLSSTDFTVPDAPTITGFTPSSGAETATVTITGTNFSTTPANNQVRFFNNVLATVTASTPTSITTSVPAGAATGPISVLVSGTGVTVTSATDFEVKPTPTISSFTPTTGAVTATVTITGTNFSTVLNENEVRFGGTLATVTAATPTSITTSVPAGAATGPLSVLVSGTGVTVTSASNFTIAPTPTITSFTPTSGAETATVTITGTNFSATPANNQVRFFNNVLATVTASTPTSITTSVPTGAATGPISVLVSGTGVTVTSATDFEVKPTPTISSFTPTTGAVTATVTITGTNFSTILNENEVLFGGTLATVTAATTTSITTSVPAGAATGPVSVLVSGTGVTVTSASNFTVVPTPTITNFTPTSGAETATVTITGTGFSATPGNNQVRFFNGVLATVTASTPTSITTSVPAGAATGPISVLVSGTGVTVTSASNFTVVPIPTITSFSPTSGAETATVTITGTGFSATPGNNQVRFFNGVLATVTASTPTSITTSVPAGAATGPISVLVSGTGVTVESDTDFNVLPKPTLTGFSPTSGAPTAEVIIFGTNFSTTPGENIVTFNGVPAVVSNSTATTITTSVPVGATSGAIVVTVNGVTLNGSIFTVLPSPTITGISPTVGASGASVTITGTNFISTPVVTFNGVTAVVTGFTSTSITTTVPVGASTGPIAVTVSGVTVFSATFTVPGSPTITSFNPTSGAIGATVVISGTNFSTTAGNNVVRFNGTQAVVTVATTTSLTVTVPAGAISGTISVTVSGVTVTSESNFAVLPTPTISSFTPTSGAVGAVVTISGTNFSTVGAENVVKFNNTQAIVTGSTTTSITTSVPANATTGEITVTVSGVTATSAANFTVLATPTISNITPNGGAVGAVVTITGTNYSANPTVRFSNNVVATVTGFSATTITTAVPSGAITGPISVTTRGVTITSDDDFTVFPSPSITSFSPTSGAPGATVTINGTNFSSTETDNVVKFNNVTATVTNATPSTLTVTVPASATTGPITVTVNGVTASSPSSFQVLGLPTIASFTPTSGAIGTTVTITGTNFSTTPVNNEVRFNGALVYPDNATSTNLTVKVPDLATTGTISVTVGGVSATSVAEFTLLPKPSIISFNPEKGAVGADVTIFGTNIGPTPVVRFNTTVATVTSSTETSITTKVPAGATTGPISVTVSGITVSTTSVFTVLPTPTVTGFTPDSGAPGATITITGANFSTTPGENVVRINGTLATVTASTSTSITVTIPAGATSGPISVTVSGVTITSEANFNVRPTPVITGFDPKFGPVGTVVEISGTDFGPSPVVKFNGVQAGIVGTPTATTIMAQVPLGTSTGPISVTSSGVTVLSASNFVFGDVNPDDTTPPVLLVNNTPATVPKGTSIVVSAQFSDPESFINTVTVTYKIPDAGPEILTANMVQVGNSYEFNIPSTAIGDLGILYKLKASNGVGIEYNSPEFIPVKISYANGLIIPYTSFGKTIGSYEIFSIPLDLDSRLVSNVFDELMPYNNAKWRISQYNNISDDNLDLKETDQVSPGVGYWLIVANNPGEDILTGPGRTLDVTLPFALQLKAGWNQIGNPYNYDLDWNDLVAANPGLPVTFRKYNGANKSFENSTSLERMRGGFVNVSSSMELVYPTTKSTNGRTKGAYEPLNNPIDRPNWEVDFEISHNDIKNLISGLGMRADADAGFDPYDGFSMPRFDEYLELNHIGKIGKYHYSKDVVPTADKHTWEFTIDASDRSTPAVIRWDNSYFGENEFALFLYEEQSNVWVDMKQHHSFTFTPPATFKVVYGNELMVREELYAGSAKILSASPNPARGPVSIYVSIPYPDGNYPVQLDVVSMTGQTVATVFEGVLPSGYQQLEWSGTNDRGERITPGLYLIRMRCANQVSTTKLIVR